MRKSERVGGALLWVCAMNLGGATGCKKLLSSSETEPQPSASAAPLKAAPSTKETALIPQGTLLAGSSCDAVPRITTEELPGTAIPMAEYSIDAYPYPNDPAQPPVTNVSRDEAAQMCAKDGKRLCTELEWERACKGGANLEYEYGNTYDASTCGDAPPGVRGLMGQRAGCSSSFGVHDMHGLVSEWTDSAWGRGTSGGLVAVRGGSGPNGELTSRCANGQGHAPLEKSSSIGFRCCTGARNPADVNITLAKQPPFVQEPSVDPALSTRLLGALGKDLRTSATANVSFDQIWRWHPRANEEIIVGRYVAKPKSGGPDSFREMAFKICGNTTHLLAQTRGAVDRADNPGTGTDAQRATLHVALGANQGDLHFNYVYGRVGIEQPPFIAGAAGAADAGAASASASATTATVSNDAGSAALVGATTTVAAPFGTKADAGAAILAPRNGRRVAH